MKKSASMTNHEEECNVSQNFAYALPKLSLYVLIGGPLSIMPGLAAKYFGLTLVAIAMAQFIARLFDSITDPLIGYFSDRYQQRFGTRKPLVLVGGIMVLVTSTMFYIPYGWDAQNPEPISIFYFMFFYLTFTLSWTVMDIPHLSWGVEVSSDAKGRSQRFSFRSIAIFTAPLIFFSIPLWPMFETTEVTPETLKYLVYISWVLMPLCLLVCLCWVPNPPVVHSSKVANKDVEKPQTLNKKQQIIKVAKIIFGNRPLLLFYATYMLISFSYSMSIGLTFFFVDNYLGVAEKLPYAYIIGAAVGVPSAWFWGILAPKIGGHSTWAIGIALNAIGFLGTAFIGPGEDSFLPYLVCKAFIGAGHSSCFVAGYMVLSNITDYGKWKFGQECSGLYFSVRGTIAKFTSSVGVAVGLLLANWLGFDPLATEMSEEASTALRFSYIVVPLIITILSIIMITQIPIKAQQQKTIRKRLEVMAARTRP